MSRERIDAGIDEHPEWCDLGLECHDDGGAARHRGCRSVWAATTRDDIQLVLALERDDDDLHERPLRGPVAVYLEVTNTSTPAADGRGLLTSAAALSPEEARHLAENLRRYADRAEVEYASLPRAEITIDGLKGQA